MKRFLTTAMLLAMLSAPSFASNRVVAFAKHPALARHGVRGAELVVKGLFKGAEKTVVTSAKVVGRLLF